MLAEKNNSPERPRLLLAYADSSRSARQARACRRLGWQVHQVASGREARRLAGVIEPALVVLDANLPFESGWLTAAKLRFERPRQRILLVGSEPGARQEQFALFLGAAGFSGQESSAAVLEEILGELALVPA